MSRLATISLTLSTTIFMLSPSLLEAFCAPVGEVLEESRSQYDAGGQ